MSVPLPPPIIAMVSAYRSLCTEYAKLTDPVLQSAYKIVLSAKYSAITSALTAYNLSVQSTVASLVIN